MDNLLQPIINDDLFEFINSNKNADVNMLRLKKYQEQSFDAKFAILQIECQKKASNKIPEILSQYDKFLFPSTTVAEQCTSEIIAKFHASLFSNCKTVLDMTAGLCIDSYYISKVVDSVMALEIDSECAYINTMNMSAISSNVSVICCDSSDYILNNNCQVDAIFVDPARRGSNKNRVYALSDCSPNILPLMPAIKEKCNFIIVKASPMIDITNTLLQLESVSDVWVLGYKNECKELLVKIDFNNIANEISVHTINFDANVNQEFSYVIGSNPSPTPLLLPTVGDYLYEPNCCIMKSGAFNELNSKFNISKLHNNTHLFVSNNEILNFPGRTFIIDEIIPFKDKLIKQLSVKYPQINVSVRNFKLSADQLKTKLKVKDGGDNYLFGATLKDNSMALLICHKATS